MQISLGKIQNMLSLPMTSCIGMQGQEDLQINSVCRDTKDVCQNSLFVCIKGERLDGHDFAAQAVEKGAVALLVSRHLSQLNVPQLIVDESTEYAGDCVKALGKLAQSWRKIFAEQGGKVIAITGSAGKTTIKEVLADILSSQNKKVARNILNYNNQVGMPLSILAASGQEDFWVMEVGISKAHDMDVLGDILQPDVALVLNVGTAHTEGLGEKGVAWHKARLLNYVRDNGAALVCIDYEDLAKCAQDNFTHKNLCELKYFSAHNNHLASVTANYVGLVSGENESGKFSLRCKVDASGGARRFEVQAPFYGTYGSENVAAIVAIAIYLGLDILEIQQGFKSITLPKQRFQVRKSGAWTIIDDSYNANPLSMQRMIKAGKEMSLNMPYYLVLGAMGELGDQAEHEHIKLGQFLAKLNISHIFWKGDYADKVLKGLQMRKYLGTFIVIDSAQDFAQKWKEANLEVGTVLFKGSRSYALESLVVKLQDHAQINSNDILV